MTEIKKSVYNLYRKTALLNLYVSFNEYDNKTIKNQLENIKAEIKSLQIELEKSDITEN
ncbi:MAG: hypothetical protein ACI4C7_02200 [Clostridia bacterium]